MRNLRFALIVAITLSLGADLAAATSIQGGLQSDAPVHLAGGALIRGPATHLYHSAFADASLSGTTYTGLLFDHRVTRADPADDYACQRYDGDESDTAIGSTNVTDPRDANAITWRLFEGAAARATFPDGVHIGAPDPDLASADAVVAELGPNPYAHQKQQGAATGPVLEAYAPVLANGTFLIAPTGATGITDSFTVEVYWGRVDVIQNGVARTYEAGVKQETRTEPIIGPLGSTAAATCHLDVTHTLTLDSHLGVMTARQNDLAGLRFFWHGAAPAPAFKDGETTPPAGYWPREREGFADALAALHLPATSISGQDPTIDLAGAARFDEASGGLSMDQVLHHIDRSDIVIGGTYRIHPESQDEAGRRMQSQVAGSITGYQVLNPHVPSPWPIGAAGTVAASTGIGLAGLGLAFWPRLKYAGVQFALTPLYARLRKEDILENPLRDDILQVVEQSPGISASELGRRLSCGWGTLVYHLTVLERMQLIASQREGRHRRFFVQGRINYSDKLPASLIANASARAFLDVVSENPGIIQRDLGRLLGLTAGTVAWHIERLSGAGLVIKEQDGRVVRYFPSTKLIELTKQMAA